MECMSKNGNYESRLWAVLEKENLVDLSQFHRTGFFDEVPLFSRQEEIDFLHGRPGDEADRILLGFALKFLSSVVSYEKHRSPFVAAITAWGSAEDPVLPNLFVWSGDIRKLRSKLVLVSPSTPFARRVKRLVPSRHTHDQFEVLQDTTTEPAETRIFISLAEPPYSGFIPLREFSKSQVRT
jgi:hypothetical protein